MGEEKWKKRFRVLKKNTSYPQVDFPAKNRITACCARVFGVLFGILESRTPCWKINLFFFLFIADMTCIIKCYVNNLFDFHARTV